MFKIPPLTPCFSHHWSIRITSYFVWEHTVMGPEPKAHHALRCVREEAKPLPVVGEANAPSSPPMAPSHRLCRSSSSRLSMPPLLGLLSNVAFMPVRRTVCPSCRSGLTVACLPLKVV